MGLYLGTDIPDASQDNAVPITTYEGQTVSADESRSDDHDFTCAHTIPNGRVILGRTKTSWGPWMNPTWNRKRMNCGIRWNNQLQCLVLYAIAPIREGDELLTFYGRCYWLAILHASHPDLQREAILEGQFSEVERYSQVYKLIGISEGQPSRGTHLELPQFWSGCVEGCPHLGTTGMSPLGLSSHIWRATRSTMPMRYWRCMD